MTANPIIRFPECMMSRDYLEDDVDCVFNEGVLSRTLFASEDSKPAPKNQAICKKIPVKETTSVYYSKHANGKKMINEYVKERKISCRKNGKVVLYRNSNNGMLFAIKIFYKPGLRKVHITSSETTMSNVLREVSIMKMLEHPNIVNLVEVIDDPKSDYLYMVLEYVEGNGTCNISETQGGMDETTARRYFKDILAGIIYLHNHNVVHGDIKPENLLLTKNGRVKIGDFGVSYVFEDDNDEFWRCLGTPAFTAPECCSDTVYHGKAADTWAVGITLYYMVVGCYPFIGDGILDTYDRVNNSNHDYDSSTWYSFLILVIYILSLLQIVNTPLSFPKELDPELKDLLQGLLCKGDSHYFFIIPSC
ncbi:hypothetical protein PVL29_007111 [Vitis rotundifolia]|uniref:non-specific serine/threonine protein kinase n=1 Tax=Vitis rotundifolia TaxID=103349 RepID=A0AA39A0U6_VITRO|nr:hypothetical protein PVL29_007111 [Vitis rotundifolia]